MSLCGLSNKSVLDCGYGYAALCISLVKSVLARPVVFKLVAVLASIQLVLTTVVAALFARINSSKFSDNFQK